MNEILFLGGFLILIALFLAFDLGVVNRKNHVISFKEALTWTCIWIGMALLFYVFLHFRAEWIHGIDTLEKLQYINAKHKHGIVINEVLGFEANLEMYRKAMSLEYITGYLIEKALSVDNIFVMIMIFLSFKVEPKYYHKVLFWGILGAVVMRFLFIFLMAALVQRFAFILWLFGGILIVTGVKMFLERNKKEAINMRKHPVVRFSSKYLPVTRNFYEGNFFVKLRGRHFFTPLFLVLLIIEFSDVIFAVDSIPAIFSVTLDPYIVFFSNIFAILGLRSLFFVLSNVMDKFSYLKTGLSVLLTFIGVKMLLHGIFHITIGTGLSLLIIVGILSVCIIASVLFPPKKRAVNNE
ncbi:MAG: TerC/Alx family metal homeostasis membrane protein [Bacteroidales bacterium]|jgi:tellurite resistance protein TerC|nr:TerC/Alx family metal homeostasis membrane protein [Bacteroidales bacterium]